MARRSRRPFRYPVSTDKRFKRRVAESGTAERWQHSGRVFEYTENAGVFVARATEEHVLDRLFLLKIIDEKAHEAGLRLHQDYCVARIEARATAHYESVGGNAPDPEKRLERSEMQEAAYRRWRRALSVFKAVEQDALIHVACAGCFPTLTQAARLAPALQKLARFYGIAK
jgi:hypothetical protein